MRYKKKILEDFPFNLLGFSYASMKIGDTLTSQEAEYKLEMITTSIVSSSNGKKRKLPGMLFLFTMNSKSKTFWDFNLEEHKHSQKRAVITYK